MLTNLVKRLTRLEPVSPVRKGIVSLSIGDFSEEQLLALPMLCRAREIGRRSENGGSSGKFRHLVVKTGESQVSSRRS